MISVKNVATPAFPLAPVPLFFSIETHGIVSLYSYCNNYGPALEHCYKREYSMPILRVLVIA